MNTEYLDEIFSGTLPGHVTFEGNTFENCTFNQVDLKGVSLEKCRLISCKFIECDLSNVQISNSRIREISFERCKLMGIQWIRAAEMVHASFHECNLNYSNFSGMKLKKSLLKDCTFLDADFSQADLSECDFRNSNFLDARFHNTLLLKSDFRGALNYLIDPLSNQVRGARFSLPEAQGLLAGLGVKIEN